ncbi:hypothetical protein SAMN05660199_04208 [Klenkia soli]|uniref:Uncharacterized protein n=1 Tax=Klenkia soli TaxID=1052260 RepID=A0A1H0TNG8_9ACTN|nr:hypothetical protein [Klenkia soli]SDP55411.1 hypothetical protein SAMN05660199_04208 [Klenkia soli]
MGRLRTAVLLALVATGVVGCSTPRAEVEAAERLWGSIPDDVRDALGLGDPEGHAWGSIGEHWQIEAELGIRATPDPRVLGSGIASACHAVVDALAGTDVQAFGVMPFVPGVVRATHETCDRGLALGSWSTELGSADSPGRWTEQGDLVLGRERDGRAEMLGPGLRLTAGTVTASSTTTPWTSAVVPFDAAAWDAALTAASTPLPLSPAPPDQQIVLRVPAGTAVTGTAECGVGRGATTVTVASPIFAAATISSISVHAASPDDDPAPGGALCGAGPVSAPIRPTLSYTTAAGEAVDVAVVAVGRETVRGSRLTASVAAG